MDEKTIKENNIKINFSVTGWENDRLDLELTQIWLSSKIKVLGCNGNNKSWLSFKSVTNNNCSQKEVCSGIVIKLALYQRLELSQHANFVTRPVQDSSAPWDSYMTNLDGTPSQQTCCSSHWPWSTAAGWCSSPTGPSNRSGSRTPWWCRAGGLSAWTSDWVRTRLAVRWREEGGSERLGFRGEGGGARVKPEWSNVPPIQTDYHKPERTHWGKLCLWLPAGRCLEIWHPSRRSSPVTLASHLRRSAGHFSSLGGHHKVTFHCYWSHVGQLELMSPEEIKILFIQHVCKGRKKKHLPIYSYHLFTHLFLVETVLFLSKQEYRTTT